MGGCQGPGQGRGLAKLLLLLRSLLQKVMVLEAIHEERVFSYGEYILVEAEWTTGGLWASRVS